MILSQFPQEKNASEVMAELSNITAPQDNKTLSETVLMTSLHTLVRLVEFQAAEGNDSASKMNFTSVCEIASNLLDSANKATWGEIDSKVGANSVQTFRLTTFLCVCTCLFQFVQSIKVYLVVRVACEILV